MKRGALKSLRSNWATVRASQDLIVRSLAAASGGFFSIGAPDQLRNVSHAIVLLFACSVLEQALQQLRREGGFQLRTRRLGDMLDGSRNVLPWRDLKGVCAAVTLRDEIAHRRHVPPRAETWAAMEAVERGLQDLGVLNAPSANP